MESPKAISPIAGQNVKCVFVYTDFLSKKTLLNSFSLPKLKKLCHKVSSRLEKSRNFCCYAIKHFKFNILLKTAILAIINISTL